MHKLDPNRAEPFNCPECHTVTWAPPLVQMLRCRFCDHVWQVRKPTTTTDKENQ